MCKINKNNSEHTSDVPGKILTLVPSTILTLVPPIYSNICKGLCGSLFHQK